MAEPNDQLSGIAESVRRDAEEGLNLLLDSQRHVYGASALSKWVTDRTGGFHSTAAGYVLDLLATLPKGTSLCIK